MKTKCQPITFKTREEAEVILHELLEQDIEDAKTKQIGYQPLNHTSSDIVWVIYREISSGEPYSKSTRTLYLRTDSTWE